MYIYSHCLKIKVCVCISVRSQITEGNINEETATDFITFCTKEELNVELNSKHLIKTFKEGYVTSLVRAGFLTSEVTG